MKSGFTLTLQETRNIHDSMNIPKIEFIAYIYIYYKYLLSDFINLTQVHNFTVIAQDIFTSRRLSVFTVSFTRILQVVMQIMKRFALYYWLVK